MAKRRANGEGNIRKRKDGRWEGRYTAGTDPETGKQIFKNVLGKTQAEVKEKLKKALEEAKKVDFTRTGKYTVEQWMDEWFENVCKIKVAIRYMVSAEHFSIRVFPVRISEIVAWGTPLSFQRRYLVMFFCSNT